MEDGRLLWQHELMIRPLDGNTLGVNSYSHDWGANSDAPHTYAALYTEILDARCFENISPRTYVLVRLHPRDEWHSLLSSDQPRPAGFTGGTRRRTQGGSSTRIPQKLLLSKGLILSCGASFYVRSDGCMCEQLL